MRYIREIRAVGLRDWWWFVVTLRRNINSPRLLDWWFDDEGPDDGMRLLDARSRAYKISQKLREASQ